MKNNNKNNEEIVLSRRKVLIGAGLAAGAASTLGLAGAALAAPSGDSAARQWDMETDVLCVGSGAAACSAAVTAAARGAKVIVIEKMPMPGGTTGKSGGVTWIPNNKHMQAQGIQDNREDALRYMARYAYPNLYYAEGETHGLPKDVYAQLEGFYDNGSKMVDRLEQIEAIKFRRFRMWDVDTAPPGYGDHLLPVLRKRRPQHPRVHDLRPG